MSLKVFTQLQGKSGVRPIKTKPCNQSRLFGAINIRHEEVNEATHSVVVAATTAAHMFFTKYTSATLPTDKLAARGYGIGRYLVASVVVRGGGAGGGGQRLRNI